MKRQQQQIKKQQLKGEPLAYSALPLARQAAIAQGAGTLDSIDCTTCTGARMLR